MDMEKIFLVEGMRCEHCSERVKKTLSNMGYSVKIDLSKGEVLVLGDKIEEANIREAIEDLGFEVK